MFLKPLISSVCSGAVAELYLVSLCVFLISIE
jgi:hypothetical protein